MLYVVYPDTDPADQLIVRTSWSPQSSLVGAFSGGFRQASSAAVLEGTVAVQSSNQSWAFNASCSAHGGGTVRFGLGNGNTCNIFYGFGCVGGTYCGVSDFPATWMASNTNRLFPSGLVHDMFSDYVQLWVR